MSLLLDRDAIDERRRVAAAGLAPLAASLAADLGRVLDERPHVPERKSRLSRAGGRCADDGTALEFDPFSPDLHRCPRCGRLYDDEAHHTAWLMWYQLWLAERTVQAALLHLLVGTPRCAELADGLLGEYVERYLRYPNRDNVLGPSRPFFSTYLESIWLLQIAVALDLREASATIAPALAAAVRERVVAPSRELIASYDERGSNRQVWNAAALLAAGRLLGDDVAVARAVEGPAGVFAQLESGLLADGTWYEGDNYHQFAHRGLWYGVSLAEHAGFVVPARLLARYQAGFAAPFATALPDFTFPSRRDSQHAVSLRQWRFAEMAELGVARAGDDPALLGALHELYDSDVPRRDTGRWRSAAESERNEPPTALSRADLGWRSLLFARESLPSLPARAPRSLLLPEQGLAILRRERGALYAALDYGRSGGGHGHPDRLNVLLARGTTRWLDDPGTGSYVDPSLHWYRSTLAHDAPLVDGRSQKRTDGRLRAYEELGSAGWVDADAEIAHGVIARRALVAMAGYLVDELTWSAPRSVTLDLPVHADGELRDVGEWSGHALTGGDGLEDGFSHLVATERATDRPVRARLDARMGDARATVWISSDGPVEWWRAVAPGPPGTGRRRFHLARVASREGRLVSVWSWGRAVAAVRRDGADVVVELADGSRHTHRRRGDGWRVTLAAGGAATAIDLGGAVRDASPAVPSPIPVSSRPPLTLDASAAAAPLVFRLGGEHYRRSEESWEDAGRPAAVVTLAVRDRVLRISVTVERSELRFAPADAVNEMDNEHPDVNGDGVQLYIGVGDRVYGWRLVPVPRTDDVRVGDVRGLGGGPAPRARWRAERTGYVVECDVPMPDELASGGTPFSLDLLVNETAPGRERRRGQLVLSGSAGEFVYLRGDRQPMDRALTFVVATGRDRVDV